MEAAFEGIIAQLAPWGLWRTDVVALARLSLVCTEASALARERLAAIREKELHRRVRVRAAQRFLDRERDLLHDREWTHNGHFVRTRVCVTFNGRIRVRETIHFGRSRRGFLSDLLTRDVSDTYITLDEDEIVLGTVLERRAHGALLRGAGAAVRAAASDARGLPFLARRLHRRGRPLGVASAREH